MDILQLDNSWEGYVPVNSGRRSANWPAQEAVALALVENHDNLPHHVWKFRMQEAMTTDTFPLLFADSLDRMVLARFKGIGTPLAPIFLPHAMSDFKDAKIFAHEGLTRRLQVVLEKGEYLAREQGEAQVTLALTKYGAQVDFSWEAFLNDDLNAFSRFPEELAESAMNTEAWLQTSILFNAAGPLDATFTGTGGLAAVAALPLSIPNLETALEAGNTYTSSGEPIKNTFRYLIVPPALELTARSILTSTYKAWTDGTGAAATPHESANVVAQAGLRLIVDPWIPIVVTTGTIGATCWALASSPSDIPLATFATFAPNPSPALFMKTAGAIRVGGGAVSPFEGDFATDNIFYKVRHVMGAAALEHRGGWASDGQ